jgi:hypothetical protein
MAGWHTLPLLALVELTRPDITTGLRTHGGAGLALPGGRHFRFLEGAGF